MTVRGAGYVCWAHHISQPDPNVVGSKWSKAAKIQSVRWLIGEEAYLVRWLAPFRKTFGEVERELGSASHDYK